MCINSACKNIRKPSIRLGLGRFCPRNGKPQGRRCRPGGRSRPQPRPARGPSVRCQFVSALSDPSPTKCPHPKARERRPRHRWQGSLSPAPCTPLSPWEATVPERPHAAAATPGSPAPRTGPGYSPAAGASLGVSASRLMSSSSMARLTARLRCAPDHGIRQRSGDQKCPPEV